MRDLDRIRARRGLAPVMAALLLAVSAADAWAQPAHVLGTVRDDTGGALPGVVVELAQGDEPLRRADTDARGEYRFDGPGRRTGATRVRARQLRVGAPRCRRARVRARCAPTSCCHSSLTADVTVTGKSTFTNLADVERPAENLVGIAQSASQGAITARQLDRTPDHAHRRGARDGAGRRDQPAQRRGQGQPVLPARLQPRSRHRLRDDGGRHAGEHADARPRSRLLRSELPDPRARQRRAVLEGSVLRRARRLRHRRRRQHQLHQQPGAADRARRRRRAGLHARAGGRVD